MLREVMQNFGTLGTDEKEQDKMVNK